MKLRMESTPVDLIKQIKRYQHCIQQVNPTESDPQRILHCMRKLSRLPIKLAELEKTGIGKTINALRKLDGNIAEEATLLITKWKSVVKKQVEEEEALQQESDVEDGNESDNDSLHQTSSIHHSDEVLDPVTFQYKSLSKEAKDVNENKSKHESASHKSKVHLITIKKEGSLDRKRKHSSEDGDKSSKKEKYKKLDENSVTKVLAKSNDELVKQEPPESSVSNDSNFPKERPSAGDMKKKDYENDRKSHKKDYEKRHHKSSKHKEEKYRENKHHREERHRSRHDRKYDSDEKINFHKHKRDKKSKSQGKDEHEVRKTNKDRKSSKESEIIRQKSDSREANNCRSDDVAGDNFGAALLGIPVTTSPRKKSSSSKSSNYQESPSISSSPKSNHSIDFLSSNVKLEPLSKDLDISDVSYTSKVDYSHDTSKTPSRYENTSPTYYSPREKPLKAKALSEEEMFSSMASMKNRRTKVYHGFKVNSKFPTLFELCVRVLQDNFDALEYTGGVPYDVLKPILEKVTVEQLYTFENYNPYLIGETDELWELHAKKHFRKAERQEYETWRDLYLRCVEEREEKLQSLTENISQSMANSAPVRKTKLAYLDAVVKPPRNVARRQAKHGTGNIIVVKKPQRDPQPSPSAVQSVKERLSKEAASPNAIQIPTKTVVKKKAPLMQKTLQLFKGLKR